MWNLDVYVKPSFLLKKLGRRVDIPAGAFCFPQNTSQKQISSENVKNICEFAETVLFRTVPYYSIPYCIILYYSYSQFLLAKVIPSTVYVFSFEEKRSLTASTILTGFKYVKC